MSAVISWNKNIQKHFKFLLLERWR